MGSVEIERFRLDSGMAHGAMPQSRAIRLPIRCLFILCKPSEWLPSFLLLFGVDMPKITVTE